MNQQPPFFSPLDFPPPREVNWGQLAQRWIAENAQGVTNLPSSSGNNRNFSDIPPLIPHQQQYGNFFMPPPTNSNLYRVHPMIPPPVPNFPPPLMSSIGYFPLPPPNFRPNNLYDTPACSSVPSQRPLFQSHAHETIKPANQKSADDQEGAMPHWFNDYADPEDWINSGDCSSYDENAVIDQQMRTKLPAWILEGLEKAEKEKLKKSDQELKEREMRQKEIEREKRRKEKGLGKFDSDSDEEEPATKSIIGRKRSSREIDENEYKSNQMLAIKRLVTDVLLKASEKALDEQIQKFLKKNRPKAKPKIVGRSEGLSSLVGYDSSSDESD